MNVVLPQPRDKKRVSTKEEEINFTGNTVLAEQHNDLRIQECTRIHVQSKVAHLLGHGWIGVFLRLLNDFLFFNGFHDLCEERERE